MSDSALKRAWQHYKGRKSKFGIITDFLFLLFAIFVLVEPLRFGTMVSLSRIALSQPIEDEQVEYIDTTGFVFTTIDGVDTLLMKSRDVVEIYNFGGTWSAQSCAELRSLNKLALMYRGKINVFFLTDEDPEVVVKYFAKKKYIIKPLFYKEDVITEAPSMMQEVFSHVPTSLVVSKQGRVAIKSVGAAKWTGSRIEATINSMME